MSDILSDILGPTPTTAREDPLADILGEVAQKPLEPEYDPEAHEGVMQEFFEGVASGGTKIVQGVGETLALVPDLLADTNYGPAITQAFEDFRAEAGIDPTGIAGAVGEVGTQFVLPGVLAARAVGAISKAGKVGTFARQIGAAGAADAVVATNDTTTIGDFFEGGPTQRDEDIGLQGDEEAVRRLLNKLRVGAEGAIGTVVAPVIARGVGAAAGEVALGIERVPGLRRVGPVAIARGANTILNEIGKRSRAIEESLRMGEEVGAFKRAVGETLATLRYRGMLPEEVGEARSLIAGLTEAEVQGAMATANRLDKMIDDVMRRTNRELATATPFTRKDALNSIEKALTSPSRTVRAKALRNLPKDLREQVSAMRGQIDSMTNSALNSDYISRFGDVTPTGAKQTISETLRANLGSYMRRRYRVFEDPNYRPDDTVMETAILGFQKDQAATESLFKDLIESGKYTPAQLGANVAADGTISGAIARNQAELAAQEFLQRYKIRALPRGLSRVAENRLPTDLFVSRKNLRDYQKALLGEVKNPLENYVATIADMAEFRAVDSYFGRIRDLAQQNPQTFGRLFRDTEGLSPAQKTTLREEGFRILGEGDDPFRSSWGSLVGYAVPDRVYRDLTRSVIGDSGVVGNSARSLYSGFLRTKGAAQYGATVLSPITQIRNVTTAALFAAMQGNIGRGANLWESLRLIYQNLPEDKMTEEFAKLQRLGVVGTQAELRELQELISKGFGYTQEATVQGLPLNRRIGSSLTDNPIGKFVRGVGQKAENLYQAGDDLWKVYNFQFERNKLANALKAMSPAEQSAYFARKAGGVPPRIDDFLDEEAARIVRNTVPNYNMAPETIKFLRKLPVGNFIAFPYEIVRTGINTVTRALDELADPSKAIQEIGLRRLTGALTTTSIIGPTLSKLAYETSGVSQEEMEAYQRSLAPPWERNARLIPTGRHEDGTPQYINYSYSNPYDLLERVIISAVNKSEEGQLLGKNPGQIAFEAFSESLSEFLAPFTEESIITAKLRDVLDPNTTVPGLRQLGQLAGGRGGNTITGAQVYNPEEDAGTKAAKSLAHVLDAIIPSAVPIDVRGGEFEPSRFARAVVNSLELNEELGISAKDRQGIERDLSQELARAFSGVTESESQASIGLRYKGFEFSRARQDASNIFNRVANRVNVTRDEVLSAYESANNARFRVFNRFYQLVQDMKSFGMTEKEIRKVLEEARVGGVDALLRGKYEPLEVSKVVLNNMRRNETIGEFPREEIRQIIRSQRGRRFGEVIEPAQVGEGSDPLQDIFAASPQAQGAAIAAPVVAPAPAPAVPQTPQVPASGASVPALPLLGADPISQLRNAEIAQRTPRQ